MQAQRNDLCIRIWPPVVAIIRSGASRPRKGVFGAGQLIRAPLELYRPTKIGFWVLLHCDSQVSYPTARPDRRQRHCAIAEPRQDDCQPQSSAAWSGSPGGRPPGPPRIRTCRFPASGSSGVGFATWRTGARCAAAGARSASATRASSSSSERPVGCGEKATCAMRSAPLREAGRALRRST
jgi:hypothetical protein